MDRPDRLNERSGLRSRYWSSNLQLSDRHRCESVCELVYIRDSRSVLDLRCLGISGRGGSIEAELADGWTERSHTRGRSVHLRRRNVCNDQADCGCLCERTGHCAVQLLRQRAVRSKAM